METETKRVTHYMGHIAVQNTACGRFVALNGSPVRWSSDTNAVTCKRCLDAMGGAR